MTLRLNKLIALLEQQDFLTEDIKSSFHLKLNNNAFLKLKVIDTDTNKEKVRKFEELAILIRYASGASLVQRLAMADLFMTMGREYPDARDKMIYICSATRCLENMSEYVSQLDEVSLCHEFLEFSSYIVAEKLIKNRVHNLNSEHHNKLSKAIVENDTWATYLNILPLICADEFLKEYAYKEAIGEFEKYETDEFEKYETDLSEHQQKYLKEWFVTGAERQRHSDNMLKQACLQINRERQEVKENTLLIFILIAFSFALYSLFIWIF